MADRQPLISGSGLSRIFKDGERRIWALQDVSIHLDPGEVVLILGPSGSGKTTLLYLLGCIDKPTSGRVAIASRDAAVHGAALRRELIGFVFQDGNLIPWLTVHENVELGLVLCHRRPEAALVLDALRRVGAAPLASAYPRDLSGGETQRVAVARALVKAPKVLLADEPTAHLDAAAAGGLLELLRSLAGEDGLAVLIATHNQRLVRFADRTLSLHRGCLVK